MRGHGAIERLGGEIAHCLDLVAGDAGGAQRLVGRVEQQLRRGVAAEEFAHAPMDGGRGFAVQLLVEDRFEQRLEGRRRRIEAQFEFADFVDESAQLWIGGSQMRDGFGRIEGEFPALSVVNHRRTV